MTADYLLNENHFLRERDELLAHLVDDGSISAEAAARERCRQRSICSEPDCEQAIDGWCAGCGAKLCAYCLMRHDVKHYDECWPGGEPVASERSGGDE